MAIDDNAAEDEKDKSEMSNVCVRGNSSCEEKLTREAVFIVCSPDFCVSRALQGLRDSYAYVSDLPVGVIALLAPRGLFFMFSGLAVAGNPAGVTPVRF